MAKEIYIYNNIYICFQMKHCHVNLIILFILLLYFETNDFEIYSNNSVLDCNEPTL